MIKQPRQKNEAHLAYIRQLPCVVCGNNIETEAAHVRYQELRAGKQMPGLGRKPDDAWAVPLCSQHHRDQHTMDERKFWRVAGIDPLPVAAFLWIATGNHELGEQIVRAAR